MAAWEPTQRHRGEEPGPLASWFGCMVSQDAMGNFATMETIMRVLEQVDAEIKRSIKDAIEGAQ